ncbi:hypothetical protein Cgig2_019522 [Carnegiea gigantea]|uniref:Uncharacterized protein n=1 Tax=Carnegiea gigantea TaxID=171969 RepID=A0A9Q1QID6_9CARY|nr:hypothetical protein Cgig2_019522 [Carnegiea gigantea]
MGGAGLSGSKLNSNVVKSAEVGEQPRQWPWFGRGINDIYVDARGQAGGLALLLDKHMTTSLFSQSSNHIDVVVLGNDHLPIVINTKPGLVGGKMARRRHFKMMWLADERCDKMYGDKKFSWFHNKASIRKLVNHITELKGPDGKSYTNAQDITGEPSAIDEIIALIPLKVTPTTIDTTTWKNTIKFVHEYQNFQDKARGKEEAGTFGWKCSDVEVYKLNFDAARLGEWRLWAGVWLREIVRGSRVRLEDGPDCIFDQALDDLYSSLLANHLDRAVSTIGRTPLKVLDIPKISKPRLRRVSLQQEYMGSNVAVYTFGFGRVHDNDNAAIDRTYLTQRWEHSFEKMALEAKAAT